MISSSGRARSTSGAAPPAMMVSVPASARGEEPVTGASTKAGPFSASAAPIARASAGRDRRHVDAQHALAGALGDAAGAEQHRLDLRRRRRPS